MSDYHVPARVWTLARIAGAHGWDVRVEPMEHHCDVAFSRDNENVEIGWWIESGKAQLAHVTYIDGRTLYDEVHDVRLRDVPAILTGGQS